MMLQPTFAILLCLLSITLMLASSFIEAKTVHLRKREKNENSTKQRNKLSDIDRQDRKLYIHEWKGGYVKILGEDSFIYPTDPLRVSFQLPTPVDETSEFHSAKAANNTGWRIGIYMRMANPQEGRIKPIVALNLCGKEVCEHDEYGTENEDGVLEGQVTFQEGAPMTGRGSWPLDLNRYGTGYDVYIIDDEGAALVGPEMFVLKNRKRIVDDR